MNKYTVKGLRTWDTHEGGGFQVTLCRDGKPVAVVTNEGKGGAFRFEWKAALPRATVHALGISDEPMQYEGTEEEAALWSHVKLLPREPKFGMRMDPDMFVEELVSDLEIERTAKRLLKLPTIIGGGVLLQFKKSPLNDALRKHVAETYPDTRFLNDMTLPDAIEALKKLQQ